MEDPTPVAPVPQKRPLEDEVEPPITPAKSTTSSQASTPLSVLSVQTPSPLKSSAPISTGPNSKSADGHGLSNTDVATSSNTQQAAKRRRLTTQEKEAQRLEKEAKAKAREEKKAQKEAEEKLKAEEKRKKHEERDEKKRIKEEEQQRLEEEKAKKARVSLHSLRTERDAVAMFRNTFL